jgi:hypothetical protein
MYWLLLHKSKLSINNKLLIYETILRPIWAYGIQLWGTASTSNIEIPVEGSAHDNGRSMVCAEYGNTEGSPNPNVTATITASASACTQMN